MEKVKTKSAIRELWDSFFGTNNDLPIDNSENPNNDIDIIEKSELLSREEKDALYRASTAVKENEIKPEKATKRKSKSNPLNVKGVNNTEYIQPNNQKNRENDDDIERI